MAIPRPNFDSNEQLTDYEEIGGSFFPEPTEEQRVLWEDLEKNYTPAKFNREVDFFYLADDIATYLSAEATTIKLKKIRERFGLSAQQLSALSLFLKKLVMKEVSEGITELKKTIARRLAVSEELAEEIAFEVERDIFPPIMARIRELYGFSELTAGIAPGASAPITPKEDKVFTPLPAAPMAPAPPKAPPPAAPAVAQKTPAQSNPISTTAPAQPTPAAPKENRFVFSSSDTPPFIPTAPAEPAPPKPSASNTTTPRQMPGIQKTPAPSVLLDHNIVDLRDISS
jgi:hypothetical protein